MRFKKDTKVIDIYGFACDSCNEETDNNDDNGLKSCGICKRHICVKCREEDTTQDHGDYPGYFCKSCFSIGEKYIAEIQIAEKAFYELEETLTEEWHKKALEAVKKNETKRSV